MKDLKTLQEAILYFGNHDNCLEYMVALRWPDGVTCPTCGRKDVVFLKNQRKWQCKSVHGHRQFSAKVGTIFEDSPLPLDKWLMAAWMIGNDKNGISSWEIHRALDVTQKTAWFMGHRIRLAMQRGTFLKVGGNLEVDETFIGGKARFMHKAKREQKIHGRGAVGKVVVMGILQRKKKDGSPSQMMAQVIENRDAETLQGIVKENVRKGSKLYSDEFSGYTGLENDYDHQVINHAEEYVRGLVHTQGADNFWSLLKRGLHGTYVSVEPFHLFRYIDEQWFRLIMSQVAGKRLTYKQLTGKQSVVEKPF